MAVSLLLVVNSSTWSQSLQEEREAFDYARVLFDDGLFDTAAEEYRRFIQSYPTSERLVQARRALADAYFRGDQLEKAVEAYQDFVDRHPDNVEVASALRNRAISLERLGKHDRAAIAFLDLYDRFRTGEYAVQDLLSAGTNSSEAADLAGAEQAFRTIITNHPNSPLRWEATYNLGLALSGQSRESEAFSLFESIRNSERESDALLEIGRLSLRQDNLRRAEQTFAELRKRFPGSRSAQESYLVLSRWYEDQEDWDKAIETYDRARSAKLGAENRQLAILGLARVYGETGRDALQLYTQFLKVYPKSDYLPDARLGLGRAFKHTGRYREAIAAFQRLQESFPDHPYSKTVHRDIGDVYAALGSPRRALAAYQRHLDLEPNPDQAAVTRLSMGTVFRKPLGWTDRALDVLADLSRTDDPAIAADAQYQLGQTQEAIGRPKLAIREYRDYLQRFAGQPQARDAERRIRYLSAFAPVSSVDTDLVDLLLATSDTPATKLRVGHLLFERRHYDEAIPLLESALADTSGTVTSESAYLLAESLLAIDRREAILNQSEPKNSERMLSLYRELSASGASHNYADDAALRLIEIENAGTDTVSAKARIAALNHFQKTYPGSDRLADARLIQADTHLSLNQSITGEVDKALSIYREVTRSKSPSLSERASYGVGRCLAIKKDYVEAENALRDFLFQYPSSRRSEEARFQLGLILLERGYLQSAAAEFADLLDAPASVDLEKSSRALLAECYFRLEDFAGAARIDETLLARGAEPNVLKRLGEAYTRLGEQEKAIAVLGIFSRKFAETAGADSLVFRRAELLAQLGRTSQAIDAFEQLTTTYRKSALRPKALSSVARLHFERENYRAALTAVSGATTEQEVLELRILSLLRLDRAKQARNEIKTFRKSFPGSKEALARFDVEAARVNLRYNKPKDARKTLEAVIKKYPGTRAAGDAEYFRVQAVERVGKPEEHFEALISFVKNHKDNSHWGSANLELANIHMKEEDYVAASQSFLNALSGELDDTERPVVLEQLYDATRNLRLYDRAITYARNLIEQYPHHPLSQNARIRIGEMYAEKGDNERAITELRPHMSKLQNDGWSSAQLIIANAYQEMGDHESALREYLKMIYNHQGSVNWLANAFWGRAVSYRALGRPRESMEELDKIVARFPGTPFSLQADQMIQELKRQ